MEDGPSRFSNSLYVVTMVTGAPEMRIDPLIKALIVV